MWMGTELLWELLPADPSLPAHRCENQELRRMVTLSSQDSGKREAAEQQQVRRQHLLGESWEGGREPADTSAKMASF